MTAAMTRERIHVSATPLVKRMLSQHGLPGEPKATTLVRLAALGHETLENYDLLIFQGPGHTVTLVRQLDGYRQVTDFHLVNLAAHYRGQLATFESKIVKALQPQDRRYILEVPQ